jgi:hypothetical protein
MSQPIIAMTDHAVERLASRRPPRFGLPMK